MFNKIYNKESLLMLCSQFIFGVLGALFIQLVIPSRNHIATVNVTGLIESFTNETSKQSLSQTEMQNRVKRFGSELNIALEGIAKEKHLVLVMKEAVITGSTDMTEEVAARIKKGISQ